MIPITRDTIGALVATLATSGDASGDEAGSETFVLVYRGGGAYLRAERTAGASQVVLVLAGLDGGELATEGVCEGRVAHALAGSNGFGYDPVFYVPAYDRTMAQLTDAQKDGISHRGDAARAMAALLAAR